jgi:glutamate racemase
MLKLRNEGPIGVYDSGLGGLTVLRAVADRFPREDLVYLGDNARVPYGTRSPQTVVNYARACASVLRGHHIKALVVACNTVSALALQVLDAELFFPVLGVIAPGVREALLVSDRKRIGVLATSATARSGAYERALAALDPQAQAFVRPAPLLVPLVDEGWLDGELPRMAVRKYLAPLVEHDIDALVLGCTHYPLLAAMISSELAALSGKSVPVLDSAQPAVDDLVQLMETRQLATERDDPGKVRIILTDMPYDFAIASRFMGQDVTKLNVTAVDL